MSDVAQTTWSGPGTLRTTWVPAFLVVGLGLSMAAAIIIGNGNLVIAVAPLLALVGVTLLWTLPLRVPLLLMLFLGLAVDATGEGPWKWWGSEIGKFLHTYLALIAPGSGIPFSSVVILNFTLLGLHLYRTVAGVRTDSATSTVPASILLQGMGLSLLSVAALCALGSINGGDLKMAKVQVQMYVELLLVGYLVSQSFRGVRDYRALATIIIVAACIKAVVATYIKKVAMAGVYVDYATSHGDSLTFAVATVLVLVRVFEQPDKRGFLLCALVLPILAMGMIENDRRLVWVQALAGLAAFWALSRRSHFKLFAVRSVIVCIPLLLVYVGAGWNSNAQLFSPIRTLRSVGDSEVDSSTLYRDLENFNLLRTARPYFLAGPGFGHPFVEEVKLPDISFFKEYRYLPHNSILGLWAFCGPIGFTGLTAALTIAVFLAARSYRMARSADERIAASMVIASIIIYMVHCWGDIGFTERRSVYLVGPALAIAGQLATATGAWRVRLLRRT